MSLPSPQIPQLVSVPWLSEHLGDPDLRVLDATVEIRRDARGRFIGSDGRESFRRGHIPRAQFVDVLEGLSDPASDLRFMVPPPARFAAAMEAVGVGEGTRVVVYSAGAPFWATRVWWLLRVFGFDAAGVLDGGLAAWRAAGLPLETDVSPPPHARFTPRFRPALIAERDEVAQAAAGQSGARLLDALPADYFHGAAGDSYGYGRLGHIPGAVNAPAETLLDADGRFLQPDALRTALAPALAGAPARLIAYCGGGIAATQVVFALTLLGAPEAALYDASLQEWARDPALPLET